MLELAIIVAVLLGASLIGLYLTSANTTVTTTTSEPSITSPPPPCTQPYLQPTYASNGTQITGVGIYAFVMSPGSTIGLCVLYVGTSPDANYSIPATFHTAYAWSYSNGSAAPPAQLASQIPHLDVTAYPATISIPPGRSTTIIEYIVVAPQDSRGFYGLDVTSDCGPIPIAVGYEPSQVNSSDFPGLACGSSGGVLGTVIANYTAGASIANLGPENGIPTTNTTSFSVGYAGGVTPSLLQIASRLPGGNWNVVNLADR